MTAVALNRIVDRRQIRNCSGVPVKVGNGQTIWSNGTVELPIKLGSRTIRQTPLVLDTNAFQAVLGMDFLGRPLVNGLLLKPARLVVGEESLQNLIRRMVITDCSVVVNESYKLDAQLQTNA